MSGSVSRNDVLSTDKLDSEMSRKTKLRFYEVRRNRTHCALVQVYKYVDQFQVYRPAAAIGRLPMLYLHVKHSYVYDHTHVCTSYINVYHIHNAHRFYIPAVYRHNNSVSNVALSAVTATCRADETRANQLSRLFSA